MPHQRPAHQEGFTLIEIIVAAGIFSVVLLTAISLFVATTRSQKKVQSLTKVQDDARFIVESMAQDVRLDAIDYSYYLDSDSNPATRPNPVDLSAQAVNELVTLSAKDGRTIFRWFPGTMKIAVCTQSPAELSSNPTKCLVSAQPPYEDVTPKNVTIESFKVFVSPGSDPFDLPPTRAADCITNQTTATGYGYDADRGVCTCDVAANDCFADQTCVLPTPTSPSKICKPVNEQPRATIVIVSLTGTGGEQFRTTFQTTVSAKTYRR